MGVLLKGGLEAESPSAPSTSVWPPGLRDVSEHVWDFGPLLLQGRDQGRWWVGVPCRRGAASPGSGPAAGVASVQI